MCVSLPITVTAISNVQYLRTATVNASNCQLYAGMKNVPRNVYVLLEREKTRACVMKIYSQE
jgi:hypothetical protein